MLKALPIRNKNHFHRSFPSKVILRLSQVRHEESTHIPLSINIKPTLKKSVRSAYARRDNEQPVNGNTIEEHPTTHQEFPFGMPT